MTDRPHVLLGIAAAGALLAAGCGGDPVPDALRAWQGTVSTAGNVTTVSNESGQVWRSAQLTEEASIGVLDGDDQYVFGNVASLAADDQRIFVLDRMIGLVRVYDLQGEHLMDIGRPGDGPGEFRRPWVLGLTNEPRLLVRDISQSRMHEFAVDTGELLADWPAAGGGVTVITPQGSAYVYGRLPERNDNGTFNFAMLAVGPDGRGDMIPLPPNQPFTTILGADRRGIEIGAARARREGLSFDTFTVPFAPRRAWAVGTDGLLAVGEATDYEFWTRSLDGSETRVDRSLEPVEVDPDEAAWYRRRLTAFWRQLRPDFVWTGADIPARKRAYVSLIHGHSGRLWVLRELAGEPLAGCDTDPDDFDAYMLRPCWHQPFALDAFGDDGRFLGALELPAEVRADIAPYIRGDLMLAVAEDSDGAVMVKRYRLSFSE